MSIVSVSHIPINFKLFSMIKEEADKKGLQVTNFLGDLIIEGFIKYRRDKEDVEKNKNGK